MQDNPLVSIVIPTYNRKKLAERLIKSLLKSTYKNIEIIVIDDASKDNTSEYLKFKFKNNKKIKIFGNKKNLFAAGSKNVGQNKAKGKFIMFVDDDNVADASMIEELVGVLFDDKLIGEVGPVNYNYNKKSAILLTRSTRNMLTTKTYHLRSLSSFKGREYWPTDDIPNAFMVRGDVVRENKIKFRPEFGIMYEESDYAYKIRSAEHKVFMVRNAKIYHDIEDSSGGRKSKDYMYHFMTDPRRPFTFARNRILFHNLYSTRLQNVFILTFWIWFFSAYYIYKFIFYSGYGEFEFRSRLKVAIEYLKGNFEGLTIILKGAR